MSEARLELIRRYRSDFELFARDCLKIRTKGGETVPFVMNEAQRFIHTRLEAQRKARGFVRAVILKGRQQGASTYVAARYYWRTVMNTGVSTYILSHEQTSATALFGIVDRFQRHSPVAPPVGTSNAKELSFPAQDCLYSVATAGTKAGGRGRSISLFHGSEVAFWASPEEHFASSIQAVPLLPGTEIILESTANGLGGVYHRLWQQAEAGLGDYIAVFTPWYISSEYALPVEPDFEPSQDGSDGGLSEADMAGLFGLTPGQLTWRRSKINEVGPRLFQQEYPSTPMDAFISQGDEPYINPKFVLEAQKRPCEAHGPLILGVDPAGMGGDRFAISARRGYAVLWIKYRVKVDAEEGAAWVRSLIDEHDPARVSIDSGGGGNGSAIVSRLRALGPKYLEKVRGVNFGGTAEAKIANPKKPGPGNRRAEMWSRMKDWLEDPIGPHLPMVDDLPSDICGVRKKPKPNGDFLLESKLDMKARQVRSPDLADAIALTFASNEYITKYSTPKEPRKFGEALDITARDRVQPPNDDFANWGEGAWMA